jgi:NADH:ubiquinone oxidoreductase subunit 4 (subunit M)
MFERVFLGKDPHPEKMKDLTTREGAYMFVLIACIVWFGIQPNFVLKYLQSKNPLFPHLRTFPIVTKLHSGESK